QGEGRQVAEEERGEGGGKSRQGKEGKADRTVDDFRIQVAEVGKRGAPQGRRSRRGEPHDEGTGSRVRPRGPRRLRGRGRGGQQAPVTSHRPVPSDPPPWRVVLSLNTQLLLLL